MNTNVMTNVALSAHLDSFRDYRLDGRPHNRQSWILASAYKFARKETNTYTLNTYEKYYV